MFKEGEEGWETTTDEADIDLQDTVTDMVSVGELGGWGDKTLAVKLYLQKLSIARFHVTSGLSTNVTV